MAMTLLRVSSISSPSIMVKLLGSGTGIIGD